MINWKRSHTVIPALPGWFTVSYNDEFDEVYKEPIVAWVVEVQVDENDEYRVLSTASPVITSTVANDQDVGCLLSPDGQVFEVESRSWDDIAEWVEDMKKERRGD